MYQPVLRPREQRKGEVDFVLIPAEGVTATERLLVLDEKDAEHSQQWKVPWRVGLLAFVYGPQGLSVHKVRGFLSHDADAVGELADYAEKTSKTEALLAELSTPNLSSERLQAALQGFSSQFGLNVQITRGSPTDQQAMTAFQALNPAVANYDPIAPQPTTSAREAASLATSAAELFFGSPVGLAAGGTALLLNLRTLAFPDSEFRSSFSQSMPHEALGLCGKTGSVPARTRVTYLWAMRVPNQGPPALHISKENSLPAGVKSPLPVTVSDAGWKYIDHARDWSLQPAKGKPVALKVQSLGDTKKLELDLSDVTPGQYKLEANWDWDHIEAAGLIDVRSLSAFDAARIVPASQDKLVANTGKIPITLEAGDKSDFEFVTKVQMERLHDEFASAVNVPFVLPLGLRQGIQKQMDVQIDTSGLQPGAFKLILSQVDGKAHDVAWNLLPPPPSVDSLPIVVNQGISQTEVMLRGQRLDLLDRLEAPKVSFKLDPPQQGEMERRAVLSLPNDLKAGTTYSIHAYVEGRNQPLQFTDALRILGPRPVITEVKVSRPPEQLIHVEQDELPAGGFLSAMLKVEHLQTALSAKLTCGNMATKSVSSVPGDAAGAVRFQQLTSDQVFVSFDTSGWPNGCALTVSITDAASGESVPHTIGRIVLLPKIETYNFVPPDDASNSMQAIVTGEELETIEKAGWTADQGQAVDGLPLPIGNGEKQQLEMLIPVPPDADSRLWLWLRNETKPRLTTIRPM